MKLKIGLFGGTFDPVHLAHLALAQQSLQQFELDRVIWIPAFISPFKKSADGMAAAHHRLAMVRLACAGNAQFEASSYELDKGGVSYSIDTLRHFQRLFQSTQFFWILGEDALAGLPQWKEASILMRELTFLVAGRGKKPANISAELNSLRVDLNWNPISSTEIKAGLLRGKYWNQINSNVAEYIRKNRLYGVIP